MQNESKVVDPTELIFNHHSYSEKLSRPMQILGKRKRKVPDFLTMPELTRTTGDEFEDYTFLAGMALSHKDY